MSEELQAIMALKASSLVILCVGIYLVCTHVWHNYQKKPKSESDKHDS